MTFAVLIVGHEKGWYLMYCGNPGRYCGNMIIVAHRDGYTKCKITDKQCVANAYVGHGNCDSNNKYIVERCPSAELLNVTTEERG